NQDSPAGNQDSPAGERWRINLADGRVLEADGVVITGMGPPVRLARQPAEHPRVLDGRTYWLHDRDLGAGAAKSFCVIGGGETAASVVMSLVTGCHPHSTIDVLTSRGVIYSRGESYDENRLYSDPGEWPLLTEAHRREFLERTDRGVVSLQAEEILNQAAGLRTVPGTAVAIEASDHQAVVTVEYGQERERVAYDTVIVATGFDEHWFERLLGERARQHLDNARAGDELERCIDVSLSVDGMTPALHLPVMAGLAQGPGFPNLTCLGLLSDRVLRRYVPVSPPASLVTEGSQRA
ncbi:MAG TPA: hypothetical protein VG253_23135, partial [Streptosporangiaceae bacterium]|nr:hypothetical protein [Streptosporangiaceae bacterium]